MTIKELDTGTLRNINEQNIYTEIHRVEGRIDFLHFCKDIPEDIREKELNQANAQMQLLQVKLILFAIKGGK